MSSVNNQTSTSTTIFSILSDPLSSLTTLVQTSLNISQNQPSLLELSSKQITPITQQGTVEMNPMEDDGDDNTLAVEMDSTETFSTAAAVKVHVIINDGFQQAMNEMPDLTI